MHRLLQAVSLAALLLFASPAVAQSAKEHAAAARKAEKAGNWKKALAEWQKAYKINADADYLVSMGDAYAKLGDKANAKKQYEAYLADPLALEAEKVKGKLAALDKPMDDLGLDLAGPAAPAKPAGKGAAAMDLGDLDLAAPAAPKKGKKDDKKVALADLGGLDLPAAPPAKKDDKKVAVDLGGLDLPSTPPAKKDDKKAAVADLGGLDLPGAPPAKKDDKKPAAVDLGGLDLPGPAAPKKDDKKAVAAVDLGGLDLPGPKDAKGKPKEPVKEPKKGGDLLDGLVAAAPPVKPPPAQPAQPKDTRVAATTPPPARPPAAAKPPEPPAVPPEAVASRAAPRTRDTSGNTRIIAYATTGLAVASLAVGGVFLSKASADSSDVRAQVRPGAEASALLEQQKTHKSLSFAGFASGLVLAGVATALFVF